MKNHKKVNGRIIVGLIEKIKLLSADGEKEGIIAKVDTGATKSSIDTGLANKLRLGPVIKSKMIKSEFTLADRSHMKYKVLIGINILKNGFLVDPSKR